jgi:ABC-type phosphate/phosphonate transport system substrate-binding protein
MPTDMKKEILTIFTTLHKEDMALAEAVARGKTAGYVPVAAEMYKPFVDIVMERKADRRSRTN